jgi:predicted acetyltransferase
MGVTIRSTNAGEFDDFGRTISAVFASELAAEDLDRFRRVVDLERNLVAEDGGRLVGTAEALRFTLTVPGSEAPAAGVTSVGVLPTHRRRGILSQLMRRQLEDVHDWGEPLAVLWASEGGIYHRFGYGLATRNGRIDAERERFGFRHPFDPDGRVRLVSHEEALELLPEVYDRACAATPGFFRRSPAWWDAITLADTAYARRGAGPLARAVLELGGRPEAYALYRIRQDWEYGVPKSRLEVAEEISLSWRATREMWRYLFGVDLIARVAWRRLAADHPLFLLAAEPARLHFSMGDGLWLRVVDVVAALAARTYASEGALVLELADSYCPWNEGRWLLEASPAGAGVERVDREPELRLDASDLGAVYLGGFSFADLARAGRIEELRPGALERADDLFRTGVTPWCPEGF